MAARRGRRKASGSAKKSRYLQSTLMESTSYVPPTPRRRGVAHQHDKPLVSPLRCLQLQCCNSIAYGTASRCSCGEVFDFPIIVHYPMPCSLTILLRVTRILKSQPELQYDKGTRRRPSPIILAPRFDLTFPLSFKGLTRGTMSVRLHPVLLTQTCTVRPAVQYNEASMFPSLHRCDHCDGRSLEGLPWQRWADYFDSWQAMASFLGR